ncbi:MAG TPA: helix-turn-helix domain-containing protein, partial [Kofleriaceae bacterium]|nr:helix-turn-helix domain-containing protein [Kofleriaceae bacterium]
MARVTKIQPRILEKIEAGNLEGLPAEVFVRGFVKSFARCVGLDESEAVERYGQCANAPALPTTSVARAFVETLVAAPKAEKTAKAAPTVLEAPPEILPSASMELVPIAEHPDVEVEIEIAPVLAASEPAIEVVEAPAIEVELLEAAQAEEAPKKKRSRKKAAGMTAPKARKKKSAAAGTGQSPVVVETVAVETAAVETVAAVETAAVEAAAVETA